jgi:hypothetical protein
VTDHLRPFQRAMTDPDGRKSAVAKQPFSRQHDTLVKPWLSRSARGARAIVQVAPSHSSVNEPATDEPTATHESGETHDTDCNELEPVGLGLATTVQAVPSHDSTRVRSVGLGSVSPTATQLVTLLQDTPERLSTDEGRGLLMTVQAAPSHLSINVPRVESVWAS